MHIGDVNLYTPYKFQKSNIQLIFKTYMIKINL